MLRKSSLKNFKPAKNFPEKEELKFERSDFLWPLIFMLTAALCGLQFYPAYLLLLVVLVNRFINDRYDFIIQLTIFGTASSLIDHIDSHMPVTTLVVLFCTVLLAVFKKNRLMMKITLIFAAYFIALVALARTSDETMRIQIVGIMRWMSMLVFIIPIACFSQREFSYRIFSRRLLVYAFIFAWFYIIDCCILGGCLLLPRDPSWIHYDMASTFTHINIHPFSFQFPRRWPSGLFIYLLCLYPLARLYKMSFWKWVVFILPLLLSRTFTFTIALVVVYVCCVAHGKQLLKYGAITLIGIVGLYFLDESISSGHSQEGSTLRISSQIDQILFLDIAKADDEDLAELGSTRGAQIIPKLELLYSLDRQWLGLGFLHRYATTNQKYIIENDLYENPDDAEEVAIGVECAPFEMFLTVGFIGLMCIAAYFIALSRVIRKLPYSGLFVSVILAELLASIGGFAAWISYEGLYWSGLALGVIILNARPIIGDFAPIKRRIRDARIK